MRVIIFLLLFPLLIGSLWNIKIHKTIGARVIDMYMRGYYTMLAIFQLLCVPMCFAKTEFHILVIVYTIILGVLSAWAAVRIYRQKSVHKAVPGLRHITMPKYSKVEWFYLALFAVFMMWQLYYAIFYGTTYKSYDDATYLAYANAAIYDDHMYLTHVITGAADNLDFQRSLQSSIIFISYLSKVTSINVPAMAHMVMTVQLILMSYATYYLMAEVLFKKKDNQLIFMVLVAVLYIFGYYSPFSMTFRLLGPIWQGKAILQVVLTPYLFVYIPEIFRERYSHEKGLLLMVLSIAASALSLSGTGTIVIIIAIVGLLLTIISRLWKNLLYLLWGSVAPAIYAVIYLVLR